MCGIAGLFSAQRAVPDAEARDALLRRMTGVIAHRGPDDEGIWHDAQGRCSLAEYQRMVVEKVVASMRAGAMLSMGKPTASIVRHYRSRVRANERRLLAAKTRAR